MKKRNALTLLALLLAAAVLLVACSAPSKADTVELRNSGTAIQWKYTSEGEDSWRTLVALSDLTGANGQNGTNGQNGADGKDGQNGADGQNGQNGVNGVDGKSVEIRKTATHVQWRTTGGVWQDLVSLAEITGAAGADGKDGVNGINGKDGKNGIDGINGTDGKDGVNGINGKDGKDGVDGINGKDGKDGVNGINGKDGKDGVDGINGKDGKDGVNGINGKDGKDGVDGINGKDGKDGVDGINGKDGKDGVCAGYFYGTGSVSAPDEPFQFKSYEVGGDLIQYEYRGTSIKLKKGHTYSISLAGSMELSSETAFRYCACISDNLPNSSIISNTLTELVPSVAGEATRSPFAFNRIYTARNDTDLQYMAKILYTNTVLSGANYNLTILALN